MLCLRKKIKIKLGLFLFIYLYFNIMLKVDKNYIYNFFVLKIIFGYNRSVRKICKLIYVSKGIGLWR